MLLKIRGADKNDWWVFGEVSNVRYQLITKSSAVKPTIIIGDGDDADTVVRIQFVDQHGEQNVVWMYHVAYLCNNDGKTVEKIAGPKH